MNFSAYLNGKTVVFPVTILINDHGSRVCNALPLSTFRNVYSMPFALVFSIGNNQYSEQNVCIALFIKSGFLHHCYWQYC
ncbi:hypothetical protein RIF29_13419 [Crotalaria pallida]|uniref:Uncharacterized protein n=1 Tax=Crotalaria pallida TaxID=3830 RepID=A0AAN9IPI8_CROPI